ncbi:exodeoxyribonuclease V subunit beta [Lysobacteraceae bacterium NML93-0792]|nr:exodeoxyribonuclease V subunit beta [Xanthomonadaceae bacterium NML93-0792]PBS14759.1 exodeoxyribonuclease V subunit beta [Xanthomonadaceae bacterium NML93-0793]PBS17741.1 exodeoxyribonuclease V subunit beta [Xanthomonadaceae bacterium NML93-0831]
MTTARDPFLDLPLDGVRAIEASAGTGKTFTLATLVVRLVVEGGLTIGRILAVTYTDAATQELRSRIRRRLVLAAELVGTPPDDGASPEAVLTRAVIDAHLARGDEAATALQRRLRTAADEIDLAAIFTIHGFCARVLRDHALESGQGFDAPELMTDDRSLREAIAADLWRAHGIEADAADDLIGLWSQGHPALAGDLVPLVRERVLRPTLADLPADPTPRLHAASSALRDAFAAQGDTFRAALLSAVEGKVLHGGSYRAEWIHALFDALDVWCRSGNADAPFQHDKLGNLTRDTLLARTSKAGTGRTPESTICDAVPAYLDALAAVEEFKDARRVELLHRLRDDARGRIARFKQRQRLQTYDDLIDRVADAIEGPRAEALVAKLRAQYAVALVDEFQDTDPRQWRIFERVFGVASGAPALFVIGDPKQAIYGFRGGDVETYLAARATAEAAPPLAANFRSRPGVLRAIAALYAQAQRAHDAAPDKIPAPFVDPRIAFFEVSPGGVRQDSDFLRDGAPAPALTLWQAAPTGEFDSKGKEKPHSAGRSRELATQACVAAIHGVLSDARAGRATIKGRPVQAGDIAVLMRSHSEATRIRTALAQVGIPAVAAGKQSLFATGEARDVHALLLALLHGADDGRLRMALSTVLIGEDAAHVAALDADGDALRAWQLAALDWRDRLQRGGPLALITDLCAQHAGRLLGLLDGERRLTNYLQLAELLQEAQAQALGLHGLVDWLSRAIASASSDDDSQLLRLESDARRVQVVTLHKSKGLEYPLVFLPFAGIGGKPRDAGRHVTVADDTGRALHWRLLPSRSGWDAAKQTWQDGQRAEDARLLYVGLTRARHALWIAGGALYGFDKAAIAHMIAAPDALAETLGDAIHIDTQTPPESLPWLPPDTADTVPAARVATRSLLSDWWVYSFTQLANAESGSDTSSAATQAAPGGLDEPAVDPDAVPDAAVEADVYDPRFAGARFGVVLHDALERSDFAQWATWTPGAPAPEADADVIIERLRAAGYADADLDDGIAVLTPLVGQTLTVTLPEGVRLADVPPEARRPEIEFQFALAPTRIDALLALLHRHGVLTARSGFGSRRQLEGLMTGLIDLTYLHDDKWYVLDYKTNRLPGYGAAQLAEAMAHSEYDLQALIYTVALHRWLRFRLGDGYDYARDFGGVRYLFCRGLDATREDAPGVQAWRFAPALVEAVDALFAGRDVERAA